MASVSPRIIWKDCVYGGDLTKYLLGMGCLLLFSQNPDDCQWLVSCNKSSSQEDTVSSSLVF